MRRNFPSVVFSSVYRSAPLYKEDQEEFLNAVARIETENNPHEILSVLQAIEAAQGKDIKECYGPRTLDLDLLIYGKEQLHECNLYIPHPRMAERRFVLEPLCELYDDKMWKAQLRKTLDQSCDRTDITL